MVKDYWKTPLAASIRTVLAIFVFYCLGRFIFEQGQWTKAPQWPPGGNVTDNLVLLPAACLLNKHLLALLEVQYADEEDVLHINKLRPRSGEGYMYIFLAISYGSAFLSHIIRHISSGRQTGDRFRSPRYWVIGFGWTFIRLIPVVVACNCWYNISVARTWAAGTGWLSLDPPDNSNAELRIFDIGQILPILTSLWFLVAWAEEWKVGEKKGLAIGHSKTKAGMHV
jgi:hypothetical protein